MGPNKTTSGPSRSVLQRHRLSHATAASKAPLQIGSNPVPPRALASATLRDAPLPNSDGASLMRTYGDTPARRWMWSPLFVVASIALAKAAGAHRVLRCCQALGQRDSVASTMKSPSGDGALESCQNQANPAKAPPCTPRTGGHCCWCI